MENRCRLCNKTIREGEEYVSFVGYWQAPTQVSGMSAGAGEICAECWRVLWERKKGEGA